MGSVRLSLTTLTLIAGTVFAAGEPNLSGNWVLDEARSDDPAEIVQKADYGGTLGRVTRGVRGSVVIGGVRIPDLPRSEPESQPRSHDSAGLVRSGHVLSTIDRLQIVQDAVATEFRYDTLKAATYEHGVELKTGYSFIVAHWDGKRFVVEHKLIGGGEITETYELDARNAELHWHVRVKNEGIRTIRVTRIYTQPTATQLNFASSP